MRDFRKIRVGKLRNMNLKTLQMKIRYYIVLAFLSIGILLFPNNTYAQKEKFVTIESVITDEEGNPIVNAQVFAGSAYARTNAQGQFTISVDPDSKIVLEAKEFETKILTLGEAKNMTKMMLKKTQFLYGSDAKVNLPFRTAYKGDVNGMVSTLNTNDIISYDHSIYADGVLTGRTLGMLGSNTIRGIGIGINVADITGSGVSSGNALFIVDGLPRDIESLRLSEIESITVLKDANTAVLYGSMAVNGVVMITTKRGEAYKNKSDFSVNYGVSTPRALPNYLNSADYMTYYNMARANDGQTAQFTPAVIASHDTGNIYRYPNIDYYSDDYMRRMKSYFDLTGEFSGGNDVAKYYANIGWYSAGGILNFGEAANARNNVFNVRGNVDLKINNWIKTSIDASSLFSNDKSQRGNYWSAASTNRPYVFTPLIPFDLMDPNNALLVGRKNDIDDMYLLGGNVTYQTNAIADSYSGGVFEDIRRKFSFNNRIDFDLGRLTEGLSFHTNLSFDFYTAYTQTVSNSYSVYEPTWDAVKDSIVSLKQYGIDARPGTQVVGNTTFNRRFGFYGLLSYERVFNDVHHITGSFLGYGSGLKEQGDFQGAKHAHLGLQLAYTYNRKYAVNFSGAYVNSVKLPEGNRTGFSPTLGLSWILSEEGFLSSVTSIDLLKWRVSGGIMNSDIPVGSFFYFDNRYTTSGSYGWNEGLRSRSGVMSSWASNANLGFAKRNSLNLGLEGMFFNKVLGAEVNYFYENYNDLIARPSSQYPSFLTDFMPYTNFGADKYNGVEAGLSLNKTFGDWNFYLGVNFLYVTSVRTKVDEIYSNAYQYRQGQPVDATFGLEALGLFQDQTEIDNSPLQTFGTVKPGDIKYKDQNNDNVIDANDEVYLRRYQAPLSGGLQVRISYKRLTLFVLGEGRSGADSFREGDYYWVDGNKKYSDVVLGAWTPATSTTATYPRLSSTTNNNNHRRSSYWLYNNDYFGIQKIQLTWKLPESATKFIFVKNMDVFVDASDLFQFAKNREIRDLRVGSEPYYRTFSAGIKAIF
jgi:TonB-linked SusC/RagA family outer membrane protein